MSWKSIAWILLLGALGIGFYMRRRQIPTVDKANALTVGTNATYPPYESVNTDGNLEGFDIDFIKKVGERIGKNVVIEDMGFDALVLATQQGKIDCAIAGISITPEKLQAVDMIHYQGGGAKHFVLVFTDALPKELRSLDAILAKRDLPVAVQIGTITEKFVRDKNQEQARIFESVSEIVMDVTHNKSSAAVFESHIFAEVAQKFPKLKHVKIELKPNEQSKGNGICVNKKNKTLHANIKKAVEELKKEGIVKALEQKWFAGDEE